MNPRALVSRVSIPLTICAIGALAAASMLARPGPTTSTATAAPVAESGQSAAANNAATNGSAANDSAAGGPVIDIVDFGYGGDLSVGAGETVTVTNSDGVVHTLTSVDAVFDTGNLAGGASGSFIAPEVAGTYSFFCAIHPSMTGTLTVTP